MSTDVISTEEALRGRGGTHAVVGRTKGVRRGSFARVAAGVTWMCVIAHAPWAARSYHTSVIDAAGAIYVLGGYGIGSLDDVWVSADGGADRTRAEY